MAKETKSKTEEKIALEMADPAKRAVFLREKIEAVRDGLIRAHSRAFPAGADRTGPASTGINRAIDDLSEAMDISDMAEHLAATKTQK